MDDQTTETTLRTLFEKRFGEPAGSCTKMKSDGSTRRYYRLSGSNTHAVGVFGPDAGENAAFLSFSKHFRRLDLPVPEIYAEDPGQRVYIEEDLGDTTLFKFLSEGRTPTGFTEPVIQAYEKVVRLLPRFQIEAGKALDYGVCHPRSDFDRQSMMWDLNYFKYYFLRLARIPFDEQALEEDFTRFCDYLLGADCGYFLYRDFQSRNVMLHDGAPWFIDYQGGRKGALQYDIASLLYDAKADIPFDVRDHLLAQYLDSVEELLPLDREAFLRRYPGYVYIRIMQALGAYGLRGFYERKTHFLQSIPYAIRNLEHLLRTTELPVELPALLGVFRSLVGSSALRQYGDATLKLTVRIQSFSYRSGLPSDEKGHGGGYVFDCRSLPNPGREERYSKSTGKDPEVASFLDDAPEAGRFLDHVFGLIDQTVENYQGRNFTDLLVLFGCTGGQHRSVYCAERLAEHLRGKYPLNVEVLHRSLAETPVAATP